jgi:hypothetical protein
MTILWSNNASTTVSGSITAASTSVQLAAGTGVLFPSPTGGDYFCATFYDQATKTQNEIVHVTARSGDVCTIVRAQEGTVAQAWNAGDIFANLVTAGTLRAFVQTGAAPAANTTIVYVGDDTSTVPNTIICTTTPVPAALALGMQFNIRVKNTNVGTPTAPVAVQLNGAAGMAATRQNGGPMIHGDVTAGEEMIFVYNGVNLTAMVSNVLGPSSIAAPPVTTFYVRTDGNDSNTGFANTPQDAFATLYGGVNAILSRYISQSQITIRIADGTYIGGCGINGGFISSWNIIGNTANPQNVTIDASGGSVPSGALGGVGLESSAGGNVTVQGITFKSYYTNIGAQGGLLWCINCNFTGPLSGATGAVYALSGGTLVLQGSFNYTQGAVNEPCIFLATASGFLSLGFTSVYGNRIVQFNINGSPVVTAGTAEASQNAVIGLDNPRVGWYGGTPQGPKFNVFSAGGIWSTGGPSGFPGTLNGIVNTPGWVQ